MRGRGLIGGFCAACAGLWSARLAAPLWESGSAWWSEAVTHSGPRILVRLFGQTFAFEGGLLTLIGEKWQALIDAGTLLLPPGAAGILCRIAKAMAEALSHLI